MQIMKMMYMYIHMRFANRFFARIDFGTPYSGDFFCTEYTYTRTRDAIQSNDFYQIRDDKFLKYPYCNENPNHISK